MSEIKRIIIEDKIDYSGILNFKEMYKQMDEWWFERGFEKREVKNIEAVKPEGKYVELWLEPYKKVTDYARLKFRIRIYIQNLKSIEIEKEGVKIKTTQCDFHMVCDGYLETDYDNLWENKPLFFFVRVLYDKFFYKNYIKESLDELNAVYSRFRDEVLKFINMGK